MPLKKKKDHTVRNRIIIAGIVIAIVILMVIYFPPAQNVTEIQLYP